MQIVPGLSFVDLARTLSCLVAFPYSLAHFLKSSTSPCEPGVFGGHGSFGISSNATMSSGTS